MDFKPYIERYENELFNNVIPFWEKNCVDEKNGGYFTCLDRDGSVYDTEKYMWMQWRIVYMFATFYAELKKDRFCKSMAYNESIKCERVVFLVKEKDVSDEERAFADNSGVILTYNKNNFSEKIKSFISE